MMISKTNHRLQRENTLTVNHTEIGIKTHRAARKYWPFLVSPSNKLLGGPVFFFSTFNSSKKYMKFNYNTPQFKNKNNKDVVITLHIRYYIWKEINAKNN